MVIRIKLIQVLKLKCFIPVLILPQRQPDSGLGRSNYRTFWCFGAHSTPLIIRISILFTFHMVGSKSQSLFVKHWITFSGLPSISRRFLQSNNHLIAAVCCQTCTTTFCGSTASIDMYYYLYVYIYNVYAQGNMG